MYQKKVGSFILTANWLWSGRKCTGCVAGLLSGLWMEWCPMSPGAWSTFAVTPSTDFNLATLIAAPTRVHRCCWRHKAPKLRLGNESKSMMKLFCVGRLGFSRTVLLVPSGGSGLLSSFRGRKKSLPFLFVCFLIRKGATEVKECLWRWTVLRRDTFLYMYLWLCSCLAWSCSLSSKGFADN